MHNRMRDAATWQPACVFPAAVGDCIGKHPEITVVDENRRNLEELFLLRNPKYRFDKNYQAEFSDFYKKYDREDFGNWYYFSWLNTLIRYFPEDLHLELRTGRNKYLITDEEQHRFYRSTIAFLGMSVGSHAALTVAMTGGARHMKLADPDTFSGDNLNRVRTGFQNVGVNKAVAVARQIYEMNPYAEIEVLPKGITEENAEKIFEGVDVAIEETDNPYWKLRIRELARARGVPVLMGTDNGDGAIVDVERYDMNRNYPILHGKIGKLTAEELKHMPPKDLPKVAGQIAGANLTVPRMLHSVAEVGKSLYSWPQLGTAATMCGALLAALARRIIVGDRNIKFGRYSVNPDAMFESDYRRTWFSRKIAFLKFVRKMMGNGKK